MSDLAATSVSTPKPTNVPVDAHTESRRVCNADSAVDDVVIRARLAHILSPDFGRRDGMKSRRYKRAAGLVD
jgi:hypothetical protein